MGFFYSFTETLIHSLWQAGLLALVYAMANTIMKQGHPLQKRDLLYGLLAFQLILSSLTFYIYFSGNSYSAPSLFLPGNTGFFGAMSEPLFYGYLAAVCFKSIQTAYKWKQFRGEYKKELIRPDADLRVFTELKAFHLGIKRKVTIWYSRNINVPLTFGFFKPVILLPFSLANRISIAETEAIILHELAHIRSRDYLLNWVLIITETIYFFNPFIKILAKNIRLEREKNCDVQVINFNYPQLLYAEALLKIARNRTAMSSVIHLGAVKRTPELMSRIQFFSTDHNLLFKKNKAGFRAALILPLFIAAGIFFIPTARQKKMPAAELFAAATVNDGLKTIYTAPVENNALHAYATQEQPIQEAGKAATGKDIIDQDLSLVPTAFAIPAAFAGTNAEDSVKEFIYDIETSQGKITQSFRLTLMNGQWVLTPQWMTMETTADSCFKAMPVVIDSIQ